MNAMKYKGYVGTAEIDPDAGVIWGQVANTRDVITFQGRTVAEAQQAFRDSVDDYLAFCAQRGESPKKPFSGRFVVRIEPEVHRALVLEAQRQGLSLNALATRTLGRVVTSKKMTAHAPRKTAAARKITR